MAAEVAERHLADAKRSIEALTAAAGADKDSAIAALQVCLAAVIEATCMRALLPLQPCRNHSQLAVQRCVIVSAHRDITCCVLSGSHGQDFYHILSAHCMALLPDIGDLKEVEFRE